MGDGNGLRFADYRLDRTTGILWHNDQVVKIQPQPLAVLRALLERPGQIVAREELRDRIWGSATYVDFEQGLNFCIRQIRIALNDNANRPQFVETLPKQGYRFVAPVESEGDRPRLIDASDDPPAPPPSLEVPRAEPPAAAAAWITGAVWACAGVLGTLLIVISISYMRQKPAELRTEFTIPPPDNGAFGGLPTPAVSPDGRRIVFAVLAKGGAQLWLRSLDSLTSVPLPGTEEYPGVISPFWSPDSRSIGFFAGGKLKKIEIVGPSSPSLPVTLCDAAPYFNGGSWNRQGLIVFAADGALFQVADTGGIPVPVARPDGSNPHLRRGSPWFLPDGKHFLFSEFVVTFPPDPLLHPQRATIRAGSLGSMDSTVIRESDSNAIFIHDRLVFLLETSLMAQPFDDRRLQVSGDAIPLADQLMPSDAAFCTAVFAASSDLLVYRRAAGSRFEFSWLDRSGQRLSTSDELPSPGQNSLELSPDQRAFAVELREGKNTDIWIYDPLRWSRTRLTSHAAVEAKAVWSADKQSIVFSSNRKGHFDLYRRAVGGGDSEELLYASDKDKYATSWSPDGNFLLFDQSDGAQSQIWVLRVKPERGDAERAFPFMLSPAESGRFSHDGKWVVFEASEGKNNHDVYLAPFRSDHPYGGAKLQVSNGGGFTPRWRPDGSEIFFLSGRTLMAAPVNLSHGQPLVKRPQPLFSGFSILGYDVSADGQRILVMSQSRSASSQPLVAAQNWTAGLFR